MLNPEGHFHAGTRILHTQDPNGSGAIRVPLKNLSALRTTLDSLQRMLSESINTRAPLAKDQMDAVSNEIVSAIHHIIINGAALVSYSHSSPEAGASAIAVSGEVLPPPVMEPQRNPMLDCSGTAKGNLKVEVLDEDDGEDCEILELDAAELLAEHVHFCEVCRKGFRRDTNLRMHMSAQGEPFKAPEALAKPCEGTRRARGTTWFSCPFEGCSRNKLSKKFRPLKSIFCVRNHFKRTHCPKMYTCDRCHKKSFSMLSDLKSHMKQCGESKWKCSCGTTFSRKDKLFGHVVLFEGHVQALAWIVRRRKGSEWRRWRKMRM